MNYSPGQSTALQPIAENANEIGQISPEKYAKETTSEYLKSPEDSTNIISRALKWLSETIRLYREKGFKGIIIYLFNKVCDDITAAAGESIDRGIGKIKQEIETKIKPIKEYFQNSVLGKSFKLFDEVQQTLEQTQAKTITDILKPFLPSGLQQGALLLGLTTALGAQGGLNTLLESKNKPGGIPAALKELLESGNLKISKELWENLKIPLTLRDFNETTDTPLINPASLLNKAQEALPARWEAVKTKIKSTTGEMTSLLDKHFPTWRQNPDMAPFLQLENTEEVIKFLGIDFNNDNQISTLEKGLTGTSIVTGAYLLNRLIGKKWAIGFTAISGLNLGFMALMRYYHIESPLIDEEFVEEFKTRTQEKLTNFIDLFGLNPENIGLKSLMISVDEAVDYSLEFTKAHPQLANMITVNASGLFLYLILYITWKFKGFLGKSLLNVGQFVANHPKTAITLGISATVSYYNRQDLLKRISTLFFDDPIRRNQFQQAAFNIFEIDPNAEPSLGERITKPLYRDLIDDPIKFFGNPEKAAELKKEIENGNVAIALGKEGLDIGIAFYAAANPIWHIIRLEKHIMESFLEELFEGQSNQKVGVLLAAGVESYIIGSLAWGAGKGYFALTLLDNTSRSGFFSAARSMYNPLSKEGRFIYRSMVRQLGDSLSFGQFTKILQARTIADVTHNAKRILELCKRDPRSFGAGLTETRSTQIQALMHHLEKAYNKLFTNNLFGGKIQEDLLLLQDIRVKAALREIKEVCNLVKDEAILMEGTKLEETKLLRLATQIKQSETRFAKIFNIGDALSEKGRLKLREWFKDFADTPNLLKPPELKVPELLENKSTNVLENELEKLKKVRVAMIPGTREDLEILKKIKAIESYLHPENIKHGILLVNANLESITDAGERAKAIESLAAELEATEKGLSAKIIKRLNELKSLGQSMDSPAIRQELARIDQEWIEPFATRKKDILKKLNKAYKNLPRVLKNGRLAAQIELACESTFLTRMVKSIKGRGKMAVIMASALFSIEYLTHSDPEKEFFQILDEMGPELTQLLWELTPFYGAYLMVETARTGKQRYNPQGKELVGWDRYQNYLWGTVSLAGDLASVLATVGTAGLGAESFGAVVLAKLSAIAGTTGHRAKTAATLIKEWSRFEKIADKMGGWIPFLNSFRRYLAGDVTKIVRTLHRVETTGMVAGLTATGVNFYYGLDKEEIEIPNEIYPNLDHEINLEDLTKM